MNVSHSTDGTNVEVVVLFEDLKMMSSKKLLFFIEIGFVRVIPIVTIYQMIQICPRFHFQNKP